MIQKFFPHIFLGWYFAVFFYGVISFPDAPYKLCGPAVYCGKGHPPHQHTESEYNAFSAWQAILIASVPIGIFGGVILKERKRKNATQHNQ